MRIIHLASLLTLLCTASAQLAVDYAAKARDARRVSGGKPNALSGGPPGLWEGRFEQPVDHFSKTDNRTWYQNWKMNSGLYKPGGPCILIIGSPSGIDWWDVQYGMAVQLAKEHNGVIVAVDQRHFGDGVPVPGKSGLTTLTISQSIADFHNFASSMVLEVFGHGNSKGLKPDKWMAMGSGYAGTLAAWLRLTHPETFYAAHAESAPISTRLASPEYGQAVVRSLPLVPGGSKQCAEGLVEAVKYLDGILLGGNGTAINDAKIASGLGNSVGNRDLATFVSFSPLLDAIEYWWIPDGTKPTIDVWCDGTQFPALSSPTSTPKQKFDALMAITKRVYTENPALYERLQFSALQVGDEERVGRQYLEEWLQCTQMGNFKTGPAWWPVPQNPDTTPTVFTKLTDLVWHAPNCRARFGSIDAAVYPPAIDQLHASYLDLTITAHTTNLLFSQDTVSPSHIYTAHATQKPNPTVEIRNRVGASDVRDPALMAVWKTWVEGCSENGEIVDVEYGRRRRSLFGRRLA
ncbi:serine carboxypeptidase S28-domain-containing protein [Powellomyces hirtus]|nr:serine carboxypeptidase S28-domain-containing protein [Powellomyces hirtus]